MGALMLDASPDEVLRLPLQLAAVHRSMPVGATLDLRVEGSERARAVLALDGAGFAIARRRNARQHLALTATRERTLADIVGPGMRVLTVGLNPSLFAADAGDAFARPGNRFWPAAVEAGIVTRLRDPLHALEHHHIGFTDLVKRATVAAADLAQDEYRQGARRVEALTRWLRPNAIVFVGLAGYRAAVDRRAASGWQAAQFGGVATYVMPNPSGLNTHVTVAELANHLRAAVGEVGEVVRERC